MNSTNKGLYLDYNATSPLASSVLDWLKQGDFAFGNPSSVHSEGMRSRRVIQNVSEFLLDHFHLSKTHDVYFHSGASEGMNQIISGHGLLHSKDKDFSVFLSEGDHSALLKQVDFLSEQGSQVVVLPISSKGKLDSEVAKAKLKGSKRGLINLTWVNNETGIEQDFSLLEEIPEGHLVHIDAVQSVGKVGDYRTPPSFADFITYSGHKFGALKGIGFTFYKKEHDNLPVWVRGGGQQRGLRSGTENIMGIYSLKLALQELSETFNPDELLRARKLIENQITSELGERVRIIGSEESNRSLTAICLVLPGRRADILLTALDLANIQVSSGSACSSGSVQPSHVLKSMGFSEEDAKCALRLSFSSSLKFSESQEIVRRVVNVLSRFK